MSMGYTGQDLGEEHTWGPWGEPFNANKQTMDGFYSQPMRERRCQTCEQVQTQEIPLKGDR